MGKILLNVLLPATQRTYDVWVPATMTVHDASGFVAGILESRESDRFSATPGNVFMDGETGDLLDPRCVMGETGLVNGSRIVLV